MAIIQFGDIITGMRGSVGGATYGNSRSGFTKRNKPIPTQPVSSERGLARGLLAFWQGQWRTLTDTERAAWNAATANFPRVNSLGITYYLTGINLFSAFNINLALANETAITAPPAPFSFPSFVPDVGSNSVAGSSMLLSVTPFPDPSWELVIESMRGQSPGVQSPRGQWFRLEVLTSGASNPQNLWNDYEGRLGIPIIGTRVFVRCTPQAVGTGQQGVPVIISFIVLP